MASMAMLMTISHLVPAIGRIYISGITILRLRILDFSGVILMIFDAARDASMRPMHDKNMASYYIASLPSMRTRP